MSTNRPAMAEYLYDDAVYVNHACQPCCFPFLPKATCPTHNAMQQKVKGIQETEYSSSMSSVEKALVTRAGGRRVYKGRYEQVVRV